jgi:predicted NBD/HSP70 family sugar kinase
MLGLGLANLINIFDPALIVLAGERIRNHQLLETEIEKTLKANAISVDRLQTPITVHRWGDGLWARGAGALALDGLMEMATDR